VASTKRLRSVVHSITHHGMSGLCFLHPHLGVVCKEHEWNEVAVDLLGAVAVPQLPNPSPELALSSDAFQAKFRQLLESEGIPIADLSSAVSVFQFELSRRWPHACFTRVATVSGVQVEDVVGQDGHRAEILAPDKSLERTRGR